jgi:hypothetical protein
MLGAAGRPGIVADEAFGPTGSFGIAVVSLISIVVGYGLLMVLWYYVFREKPEEKAARREREAAALRAAAHPDNAAARRNDDEALARDGRRLKIEPRIGPPFRRR